MSIQRALTRAAGGFVVAALMTGAAVCGVACGGGGGGHVANIQPGEMPAGETWTGVYFHPVYGYLHLVEQDSNIIGRWERADRSAWGEMSGTKTGNVYRFTWKEHKIGLIGPSAESKGHGVFIYKVNDQKLAELDGQYGVDEDETGSDWHNVKQQRMQPDLKSIPHDASATATPVGESWH